MTPDRFFSELEEGTQPRGPNKTDSVAYRYPHPTPFAFGRIVLPGIWLSPKLSAYVRAPGRASPDF